MAAFWGESLSESENAEIRTLFVGGPGRSGTSFVADRIGRHPNVCSFPNIELKIFTEKNGLIDLHHALVETFSPNRATVALEQFQRFYLALVDGRFGQQPLSNFAPRDVWVALQEDFYCTLTQNGQAGLTTSEDFHTAARRLLSKIAALAARVELKDGQPELFLEKTPHALLSTEFLTHLSPSSSFLHIMRDPRSIAFSLRSMTWGPKTLAGCCTWVANYCEAWTRTQKRLLAAGLEIVSLQIEMIANAPHVNSEQVCRAFCLQTHRTLFDGADIKTLNGWIDKCSHSELEEIDSQLCQWCNHLGYSKNEIGVPNEHLENYAA